MTKRRETTSPTHSSADSPVPKLRITKLDAARRQLEVAVRLYFYEADPVSLHTLTAAAYNVLRDVNRARDGSPMFVKDNIEKYIKPEFVDQMWKRVVEAENFFKHADHDPDGVLEFRPGQTEILLLDACEKYRQLTGEAVAELTVYIGWLMLQKPAIFIFPSEVEAIQEQVREDFGSFSRSQFFAEMLLIVTKRGIAAPLV
jgi:hypothetical protein